MSRPVALAIIAMYIGTTVAGQWLNRVVAHTLGRRGSASVVDTSLRPRRRDDLEPLRVAIESVAAGGGTSR